MEEWKSERYYYLCSLIYSKKIKDMKPQKIGAILAQKSPYLLGVAVIGYLGYYATKNGIPFHFEYQGVKVDIGSKPINNSPQDSNILN